MINRVSWEHSYLIVRGEILGFVEDELFAKAFAKDVFIDQVAKVRGSKTIRYRRSLNHKPCRLEMEEGGRQLHDSFSTL